MSACKPILIYHQCPYCYHHVQVGSSFNLGFAQDSDHWMYHFSLLHFGIFIDLYAAELGEFQYEYVKRRTALVLMTHRNRCTRKPSHTRTNGNRESVYTRPKLTQY